MSRIGIVIPTLNAGGQFHKLMEQMDRQTCPFVRRLVIDSSSADDTQEIARTHGFEVLEIPRSEFNHGGTRQRAFVYLQDDVDILIYLTQDVLLADSDCLQLLAAALEREPQAGAVYGRQLPHMGASPGACIQRLFNYPEHSMVKSFADRARMGIKTAFLSDSFTAYRCAALADVGGFSHVAACEDMDAGARLLMKGYTLVYAAEAMVHHSHDYSCRENFCRYYVTGVFHKQQSWIRQVFGGSEREGMRLLRYQIRAARKMGGWPTVASLIGENCIRYAAYCLGRIFG